MDVEGVYGKSEVVFLADDVFQVGAFQDAAVCLS
jgi:hypothetical protein